MVDLKLFSVFFILILMFGSVMAVVSETNTEFVVSRGPVVDEAEFVQIPSFWDKYGGQLVAVGVLVVIYFLFKMGCKKKSGKSKKRK
jgi:hypothetical protein